MTTLATDTKMDAKAKTKTVLIVEDNAVNAAVFEGMLDELGCSHATVNSGREAVSLAATRQFDAILMDVQMPDMDGWAATALIRRAEPPQVHTPIIALTADASEAHRQQCLRAGMDDFLSKPEVVDLPPAKNIDARAEELADIFEKTLRDGKPFGRIQIPSIDAEYVVLATGMWSRQLGAACFTGKSETPSVAS